MQLESYISDLLYRYECVIIPTFGAFLTNHVSANIHQSTHTFYPPKKVLSFNEQLQTNDGLLANYISEIEKTPYDIAVKKIANQVSDMKSYLVEGDTIRLNNIGELVLNTEGKMVFSPSFHINYLTNAFGLSHFTKQLTTREVYKESVVAIEAKAPIALTAEKRSNTNWLKYAAVAVILLGLSGGLITNHYNNTIANHNQLAQENANEQLDAKLQEATFFISNPLPAATLFLNKQDAGNYHIVAGAFKVEANANRKVKQLKAEGFSAKKIGKNKSGLHVVIFGSFAKRKVALRELNIIKEKYDASAWLLYKKVN